MLKKRLSDEEAIGLSPDERRLADKYVRKFKTAGALKGYEAIMVCELFMLGSSVNEIHYQYPAFTPGQIALTIGLNKWGKDREKVASSIRERVKAKVVKSVIEQVDVLTTMLSVSAKQHLEKMKMYIADPKNNPMPDMRIETIKEYKEVSESLMKLVQGTTSNGGKPAPILASFLPQEQKQEKIEKPEEKKEISFDDIEAEVVEAVERT